MVASRRSQYFKKNNINIILILNVWAWSQTEILDKHHIPDATLSVAHDNPIMRSYGSSRNTPNILNRSSLNLRVCYPKKKKKMQPRKTRLMYRRTAARPQAVNKHQALIRCFWGLRVGYTHCQNRPRQKKKNPKKRTPACMCRKM